MNKKREVKITQDSIETELMEYKDKPYDCIFEYIWNSFDAGATEVDINYEIPKLGAGYIENLEIVDNGDGWNFDDDVNTSTFLSSTKSKRSNKDKTLPRGKLGRGRYVFIWLSENLDVYSNKKKLSLRHNTDLDLYSDIYDKKGTKLFFYNLHNDFCLALCAEDDLKKEIVLTFGWFLKQCPDFKITINGKEVNCDENIRKTVSYQLTDFSEEVIKYLKDKVLYVDIILWKNRPSEYSNFYFLDENKKELFKKSTGLNKKSDSFWHSIYVTSDFFTYNDKNIEIDNSSQNSLSFITDIRNEKKAKDKVIQELKDKLIKLRKPYLIEESSKMIENFKEDKIIPNLTEYGIYDEDSYNDLLKSIYVITPSLFIGKADSEKRFICATFAGLLSTQDNHLIQLVVEQLQKLSDEEKLELTSILERTSLSNVVKTIKEIDHRLDVIEKLNTLLFDMKKETLEVKHLQKILNENFWIFGEQFRLFANTEGSLKNTILSYAKEILHIEDAMLNTEPRGELDLFLTKTEQCGDSLQRNIIIEIKRPSVKLKKQEYDQIDLYRNKILEQDICKGSSQYWEFYLIGNDYDNTISELIENSKHQGEVDRGLVLNINSGRIKVYVRKWSDILQVEWGAKMKHLKDRLQIESKKEEFNSPQDIIDTLKI